MIDKKGASLTCNTKKLTENRNRERVKGEVENGGERMCICKIINVLVFVK